MSYDGSSFVNYEHLGKPKVVEFGNDKVGKSVRIGSVPFVTSNGTELMLTHVFHILELRRKLISGKLLNQA